MSYDGSGRRISKTRWVKNVGSQDWEKELVTHNTGIGTEVREKIAGPTKETKVVVNIPVFFSCNFDAAEAKLRSLKTESRSLPVPPKATKPKKTVPPKQHPPITLDAILPGRNPVAILKFHGESAVVSVGQKIWDVTVVAIKNDRVILKDEIGKFELKN